MILRAATTAMTLAGLAVAGWAPIPAHGQTTTNVIIAFTTANAAPLNLGFAGFTTELLGTGIEYGDPQMQAAAAQLSPGWLLFPAGSTGDAFNWQNGLTSNAWITVVAAHSGPANTAATLCSNTVDSLIGKGGAQFTNFASLAGNLGGAKIIVCINAFTDSTNSAGAFAAFALTNHLPVAVWELCNEPYLFQGTNGFFTNGYDYCAKMLPYCQAIKAADSNAVVAVFFSDPARPGTAWNNALQTYGATNQYWDAVVYHYYPELPTNAPFAQLMAYDNGVLFSNTTLYVTNTLIAKTANSHTRFLLTEFNPSLGNGLGAQYPPTSTLYAGIYGAEMLMRLATCPRMSFAGSYQLVNPSGVDTTNEFWNAVTKAAADGYVTNTTSLPFGFFLSAQGAGEAVANWALNRSIAVYPTTVGTNCPVVPMDINNTLTMPAVYGLACQGGNGKRYVLLTNKGSNSVPAQITQDDDLLTNQLLETFISGGDPSVVNSNPPTTNNIAIQTATVSNPMVIPPYSVVRLEWDVFAVPPPMLAIAVSNQTQNLLWVGMTNVVYNVQSASTLSGTWTTLGRALNNTTDFSFTNWSSAAVQFYRLFVP
jgi:hypothetical protein